MNIKVWGGGGCWSYQDSTHTSLVPLGRPLSLHRCYNSTWLCLFRLPAEICLKPSSSGVLFVANMLRATSFVSESGGWIIDGPVISDHSALKIDSTPEISKLSVNNLQRLPARDGDVYANVNISNIVGVWSGSCLDGNLDQSDGCQLCFWFE